jgi:hypothetical protein
VLQTHATVACAAHGLIDEFWPIPSFPQVASRVIVSDIPPFGRIDGKQPGIKGCSTHQRRVSRNAWPATHLQQAQRLVRLDETACDPTRSWTRIFSRELATARSSVTMATHDAVAFGLRRVRSIHTTNNFAGPRVAAVRVSSPGRAAHKNEVANHPFTPVQG